MLWSPASFFLLFWLAVNSFQTTKVWGYGPSSHLQSVVQLVVEETEGIKWVVTATERLGKQAECLGPEVNKDKERAGREPHMSLAMDPCGIPWLWAFSKKSIVKI